MYRVYYIKKYIIHIVLQLKCRDASHLTIPVITHERADMIANVTQKENETDSPFSIQLKKKKNT